MRNGRAEREDTTPIGLRNVGGKVKNKLLRLRNEIYNNLDWLRRRMARRVFRNSNDSTEKE